MPYQDIEEKYLNLRHKPYVQVSALEIRRDKKTYELESYLQWLISLLVLPPDDDIDTLRRKKPRGKILSRWLTVVRQKRV